MIRKFALLSSFIFIIAQILDAQPVALSVSDFIVESNNPSYTFLGKGISRLVATELRKSGRITLIEREQLNKVLKEQELSLSDFSDSENQVRVGKLLSAKYIIVGEIIDMASVVLVSLRMVNVETGEVVWNGELEDKLSTYDYIGAYFAKSILSSLSMDADRTTIAKIEKKEEKKEEAIIKTSEGIDAYDNNDVAAAKRDLEEAKKLDSGNEVASEYLSKLETVSPKFRVDTELYASSYNPASLGFINKDLAYTWITLMFNPPNVELRPNIREDQRTGDYWASNFGSSVKAGYMFPLYDNFGIGLAAIFGGYRWLAAPVSGASVFDYNGSMINELKNSFWNLGGSVDAGVRVADNVSMGATFMMWNAMKGEGTSVISDPGVFWAAGGGFMVTALEDRLTIDSNAMYTNQGIYYADLSQMKILSGKMPLLAEGAITYTLLDRMLFIGLKGIGNIYLDARGGYAIRLIPVMEYRPVDFMSLRAGYEYSHLDQSGKFSVGHGFLAGASVRISNFELNLNLTYSTMPARLLPGYTVSNITLLLGATYSPQWISR